MNAEELKMTPERYKNAADFLLAVIQNTKTEYEMKTDLATAELILRGEVVFSRPDILSLTEKGRRAND